MMIIWVLLGVYLAIGSVFDKKSLFLPGWFLWIGCLMGTGWGIYRVACGQILWHQWITACLPGILWIILAFATKERMGYGDGVVLLVIGSLTDMVITMGIVMLGLGVSCVCGVLLLISKRGNRNTDMPFVPMLFLAYIIMSGGRLLF